MGHIRLGTLPQSKKWRGVIGFLDSDASLEDVAEAAAPASKLDLGRVEKKTDVSAQGCEKHYLKIGHFWLIVATNELDMRQSIGTRSITGEQIVKDIKRATRKQ